MASHASVIVPSEPPLHSSSQYKKAKKANDTTFTLPADKKNFLNTLIEALVRRMQWRQDATWGMDGDAEGDADPEEVEAFMEIRRVSLQSGGFGERCV
jgi:hypothetical protein